MFSVYTTLSVFMMFNVYTMCKVLIIFTVYTTYAFLTVSCEYNLLKHAMCEVTVHMLIIMCFPY